MARDKYDSIVPDINEFVKKFSEGNPEYVRALGIDAIVYNANKLHIRGWN